MLHILPVLKIYSTRNVHCKFLVLVMNIRTQSTLLYSIIKLFFRLMEVAEKEDKEREREAEIASLKAFIKSFQNELVIAKTSQISRSEVPATSSKSEVHATFSKSAVPATSKSEVPAASESQPSTSTVLQRRK